MLASDPDGDRLAVAVPDPAAGGGWRKLTGDQVGALLGAFVLGASPTRGIGTGEPGQGLRSAARRSTVVSSTLLSKIAAAAGVQYAETLTGFKWIVRAADERPRDDGSYSDTKRRSGTRSVTWCGTRTGSAPRSPCSGWRPGLGGRAVAAGPLGCAGEGARGPPDRAAHAADPGAWGDHGRAAGRGAAALGGFPVRSVTDLAPGSAELPPTDALILRLDGARVVLRPSGTEPKLKAYLEVTEPVPPGGLAGARRRARARMTPLRAAVEALLAPVPP